MPLIVGLFGAIIGALLGLFAGEILGIDFVAGVLSIIGGIVGFFVFANSVDMH